MSIVPSISSAVPIQVAPTEAIHSVKTVTGPATPQDAAADATATGGSRAVPGVWKASETSTNSTDSAPRPSENSQTVDSVSLSMAATLVPVHGEIRSATVTYANGEYVASEPGPPPVSASGGSPSSATEKLVMAAYRFG